MQIRRMVVASFACVVAVVPQAMTIAVAAPQFANIPAQVSQVEVSNDAFVTPKVAVTGVAFDVRWNAITAVTHISDVSLCGTEIGSKSTAVRTPRAVVSIGAVDDGVQREYYAVTNDTGQLVEVAARDIIVQDDGTETATKDGRYCDRLPYVPGAGNGFDRGHVIADSLGGESNLYNLTPQQSALNRHGDQAFIEDQIRKAGGAQNFHAVITYPDAHADVPTQYSIAYAIDGVSQVRTFANMDPEATVDSAVVTQPSDDIYVLPNVSVTDVPEATDNAVVTAPQSSAASSSSQSVQTSTQAQDDASEDLAVTGTALQQVLRVAALLGLLGVSVAWLFGRVFS